MANCVLEVLDRGETIGSGLDIMRTSGDAVFHLMADEIQRDIQGLYLGNQTHPMIVPEDEDTSLHLGITAEGQ